MTSDVLKENEKLVRQFEDEFWGGRYELADVLLDDDFVRHGGGGEVRGRKPYVDFIKMTYEIMPDFHHRIEDLVVNEETGVVRVTVEGTFTGNYKGIKGKGQKLRYTAFDFIKIRNGKVYEMWGCFDTHTLFSELGIQN